MPNCFSLTRKSEPEKGPVALNQIDEEMCKHFGVDVHEKEYMMYWYSIIGLALACGKSFEEIQNDYRNRVKNSTNSEDYYYNLAYVGIIDWLEANFTSNAWAER